MKTFVDETDKRTTRLKRLFRSVLPHNVCSATRPFRESHNGCSVANTARVLTEMSLCEFSAYLWVQFSKENQLPRELIIRLVGCKHDKVDRNLIQLDDNDMMRVDQCQLNLVNH